MKTEKILFPINILRLSFFIVFFSSLVLAQEKNIMPTENENGTNINFTQPNSPQANGDSVSFRNETGNAILKIIDQGNDAASILLKSVGDTLNSNQLYQTSGQIMWKNTPLKRIYKYSVGFWYQSLGGYVIEVSPNGKHGIVVTNRDLFVDVNWYQIDGVYDINNESYWSSSWSYSKNFKDWRLPTRRELLLIKDMQTSIGGFSSDYYWSSSQLNHLYAYVVQFPSGNSASRDKGGQYRVRVVRTF